MNVVVMMAGSSEEFYKNGSSYSKFLFEINSKSILERVIENLNDLLIESNNIIFIIRREDNERHYLKDIIKILLPTSKVSIIENEVAGAAAASLTVVDNMLDDQPLLLVNGDQIIETKCQDVINNFDKKNADAGVIIFESLHPRWSFVKCDKDGYVQEAAEKKPISKFATAGFYYYKEANNYIACAKKMILKDNHLNNKFFICPVFNEMILMNKKIATFKIDSAKYHSLMSPKTVKQYERYLNV